MKIAMVSLYLPGSSKIGSGYQAHYMANAMVRYGHEVTMFSPCAAPDDAAYETRTLPVGSAMRTFRFAWTLRSIDFSAFDVIHAHGDDYWLWNKNKPVHIRTMHGSCFAEAKHIPGVKEKLRMTMLGLSEVLATRVADRTVCVSLDTLRYYPGLKDVIVNGVDTSAFQPGEAREENPTILFVGTFHNRKRGAMLWEIFTKEIRPALPSAQLWMVCDNVPDAPGVTAFGRVPFLKLTDLFRRASVFCLPSSYEGFGVPYIEAMASGTPVVATPNPGACEVLQNGEFGVIAEPENLSASLLSLLTDAREQGAAPNRRTAAGTALFLGANRERVRKHLQRRIGEKGGASAGEIDRTMNIALFASAFHPHFGGVEELVRQIAHTHRRKGHQVIVVTNRWPRTLPAYEEFEGLTVYRFAFRTPEGSLRARATYQLTNSGIADDLFQTLRKHEIEVLHVQCISSNGYYALLAKRKLGLPLVITAQGELTMDAGGLYQRPTFMNQMLGTLLEEADFVTGCSRRTLEDVFHHVGREPTGSSAAVFNGVNPDDFLSAAGVQARSALHSRHWTTGAAERFRYADPGLR
jgi:glycosyltransferase involved in cell wall biosynthesis